MAMLNMKLVTSHQSQHNFAYIMKPKGGVNYVFPSLSVVDWKLLNFVKDYLRIFYFYYIIKPAPVSVVYISNQ